MPDPDWTEKKQAPRGESADEKLRRLQMQVASGARAGAPDQKGAAPQERAGGRSLGEWLIIGFAAVAVLAGAGFAVKALTGSSPQTGSPAASPAETPDGTTTTAAAEPGTLHRWLKSDDDEAAEITAFLDRFFAAGVGEKEKFFAPSDTLQDRLQQYEGHELLASLPAQRYAKNIYISSDGLVSVDTNISGHGFRPVVLFPDGDSFRIDFDSYIGHIDFAWEELLAILEQRKKLELRVLLKLDRSMTAKVPGDVIVAFQNPALESLYHAHLSILDVPETHIVKWLNAGVPLPFTITLVEEESLYGKILRVEKVAANAWLIDHPKYELAITP